ncbi:MAG: hypothetical protein ACFFB3_11475, partial [Candidatus Hodarchaeota archaeon]
EIRHLKTVNPSALYPFHVILSGLSSTSLFSLVEDLSHYYGFVVPESSSFLNKRSKKSIEINYRVLELPEINKLTKKHLRNVEALIFVVPSDSLPCLSKYRKLLFGIQKYMGVSVPVLVLIDHPKSESFIPVTAIINGLGLTDLAEKGLEHLGIYPVCTETGEGLSIAIWWLVSLFLEKFQNLDFSSSLLTNKAFNLPKLASNKERENFGPLNRFSVFN